MILGPLGQDRIGRILQINLDSLVGREIESDGMFGLVGQCQFDLKLADLGQFHGLWRDQQVESETIQLCILVLRKMGRRKWMKNPAEPASFFRGRGRSGILAKSLRRNREEQSKAGGAVSHERV